MKVSELIAETVWTPGRNHASHQPELTVILPTFRRGADGLLRRVLESILGQSMRNFELIVIDDASTDGTAAIVQEFMRADDRISLLHHPKNIGLPAVSEYEAYVRSSGRYIGFAFDDYVFAEGAFEQMVRGARSNPGCMVHGYSEFVAADGSIHVLGRAPSYDDLRYSNFIANASVVLPREVVETVGLYDPHIMAARLCDWDLWRRIYRKHKIVALDTLTGREMGASRADSLGNSYPLFFEVMQEFFSDYRDDQLVPARFEDRDVWALPDDCSLGLFEAVVSARAFFAPKAWAGTLPSATPAEVMTAIGPTRRILGIVGKVTSLQLTHLESMASDNVRLQFIDEGFPLHLLAGCLAQCDAIVKLTADNKWEGELQSLCAVKGIPLVQADPASFNKSIAERMLRDVRPATIATRALRTRAELQHYRGANLQLSSRALKLVLMLRRIFNVMRAVPRYWRRLLERTAHLRTKDAARHV